MASDQELSLTWFSICEEVLSKISGVDAFYDAIKIWVERPQVLNRRLVGSYIIQSFLTAKCSDMFTKLLTMKETILREDMFSLIERCKEENKGIDKDVVEVKIRSLLPRESSKYCNVLELVIQGMVHSPAVLNDLFLQSLEKSIVFETCLFRITV